MSEVIKLMVVDDQDLFREGLRTLLSVKPEFDVVAEAANGEEAIRLAANYQPKVILMDLRMPVMDGVTAIKRLRTIIPECRVIILTTFDDDEDVFDGLRAGAVGFLLKDVTSEKLYEAIFAAARGEYFLQPSITARVLAEFSRTTPPIKKIKSAYTALSERETQILKLVSTGASNKEIAENLIITEGTVKNHLSSIFSKLYVKDRIQAVLKAKEIGII